MTGRRVCTALLALATASASACSTDSGSRSDAERGRDQEGTDFPQETSADGIRAFLSAELYRSPGWIAQSPGPRDSLNAVSPHGRVQVRVNRTLFDSIEAGNGASVDTPPHDPKSMAVKELYDDSDTLVGRAALLRPDDETTVYFCYGPAGRCVNAHGERTMDDPLYSDDATSACAFCHGGLIFSVKQGDISPPP